jgi:oxalate decarboxylase/phosphoglucose isomerase-like protein (cupin superfamily)
VLLAIDDQVPGADMYGGVNYLAGRRTIPVHWHDEAGEMQFILSGEGVLLDADGNETPVRAHDLVFSPAGPKGAHGYRNTSDVPLAILFFYPSAGGRAPSMHLVEPAGSGPSADSLPPR